MLNFGRAALVFFCLALAGCGGGGSSAPLVPPAASQPTSGSVIALTSSGSTVALPGGGGYSGSVTFAAISSPASVLLDSSTQAPAGLTLASAAKRRVQSGTLSEFFFVDMTPQSTITFPILPGFTLSLPPTFDASGKQFYYAISQPASAGVYARYRTEGPGNVSGTSVEFDATANPLILTAGTKYTFAFYAISTNNTSADKLLYVVNSTSITAYPLTAQGNVAPVRTLQGPATGLGNPLAITSDSAGNLFVVNIVAVDDGPFATYSTVIEVFAEGASGNTAPIRTFTVSDDAQLPIPTSIAVDSNGLIYLVHGPYNAEISVFSPTGTLLKVLPQAQLYYPESNGFFSNGGLTIDKRQNLIVSGLDCAVRCDALSFVLPGNATSTTLPLYALAPINAAYDSLVAYAKDPDVLFTLPKYGNSGFSGTAPTILYAQQNAANAPILRQTTVNIEGAFGMAVDPTGQNVFVTDFNGTYLNKILRFVAGASTFVPGTPIFGSNTGLNFPGALTVGAP